MTKDMNFKLLCDRIESECEQYTLNELVDILKEQFPEIDMYCEKTLKSKLMQKYGNDIVISNASGKLNVVTLKKNADQILTAKWYNSRQDDPKDNAIRIITTAAELIKCNIRATDFDVENYPSNELIQNPENGFEWLPPMLRIFLEKLIPHPVRKVSIGHSIIFATRPRSSIACTHSIWIRS